MITMSDHDHETETVDPRIAAAAMEGCEESRLLLHRRAFMGISAGLCTWAMMPRSSSAAGEEERLLVVILRGGMDGLHVVPPATDPNYIRLRRSLALDPNGLNRLNSDLYLHPSLKNFYSAFQRNDAAIVHAIAPPLRIRSHFDCQYNMESGLPGGNIRSSKSGWMNRLLQVLPAGDAVRVDALQVGPTPMILAGEAPTFSWSPDAWPMSDFFDTTLQKLYDDTDTQFADLLRSGISINKLAKQPANGEAILNLAFYGAGKLLAAPTGPRIATLAIAGFDSHTAQIKGLNSLLGGLDNAIADFRRGLGETAWRNTVVVCVSEFGRTVFDNGRDGTDHGVGTVALLCGGAVNGGIHGHAPTLDTLVDNRDLVAHNDTRALFKGVLRDHLGVPVKLLDSKIFPDSGDVPPMENLIKSASARNASQGVSAVSGNSRPSPTSRRRASAPSSS